MVSKLKYLNVKTTIEHDNKTIVLDSKLEHQVYEVLTRYFPQKSIKIHYPVLIKPETELYKPLYWKVDFYVANGHNLNNEYQSDLIVEVKGKVLREFKVQLKYLEYFNNAVYRQLKIVSKLKQQIDRHIQTMTVNEFWQYLELEAKGNDDT